MEGKIIEHPAGYLNNLEKFAKEDSSEILKKLSSFVPDVGSSQITAWIGFHRGSEKVVNSREWA